MNLIHHSNRFVCSLLVDILVYLYCSTYSRQPQPFYCCYSQLNFLSLSLSHWYLNKKKSNMMKTYRCNGCRFVFLSSFSILFFCMCLIFLFFSIILLFFFRYFVHRLFCLAQLAFRQKHNCFVVSSIQYPSRVLFSQSCLIFRFVWNFIAVDRCYI